MGGGGKGKKKKTVVGYEYYMAGIFGLCMKADKLLRIVYGDRVAWNASKDSEQAADKEIAINQFNLYGGNEVGGSGGLQGKFFISMGKKDQFPNWIMTKYLGDDVYAHRNIVTLSMDRSYVAAFSPQFRVLSCLLRHTTYTWNTSTAIINTSEINPAHEIRDVLINPDLGGQYSTDDLDSSSFTSAAQTLYNEKMGLSPKWDQSESARSYIQSLLDIIDGVLVKDRATGKLKLKLLRGGYDINTLPIIGPKEFSSISSMTQVSLDSLVNRVTIKYTKITEVGEEETAITQENQANIELQSGRINSIELNYAHITNAIPDLAPKILSRELRTRSYPLRSFTMTGKTALSNFTEGDIFVLNFPERGIEKMVCRVLEADYGTFDSPIVTLTCTEDIFSADLTQIASVVPPTEWTDPFQKPTVPTVYQTFELPYYFVINEGVMPPDELAAANKAIGWMGTLAQKPNPTDYGYTHQWRNANGVYEDLGQGSFVPSVLIGAEVKPQDTSIPVGATSSFELNIGDFLYMNGEFMTIKGWTTTTITVNRGMLDTLPRTHAANSRLWLAGESGGGILFKETLATNSVSCVLATFNSLGAVNPSGAASVSQQMNYRQFRPYPPAYLRINNLYFPTEFEGEVTLSWRHRDRTLQQDVLVTQDAANIGPETGTTYTLKIYDENDVLRKNLTDLTGTSYTWDTEAQDSELSVITMRGITAMSYSSATTSKSATVPTAAEAGNTILVWVMHQSDITSAPAGYLLKETESCTDGTSTFRISLYSKDAVAADAGATLTFTQATAGWMAVNINLWNFPAGLIIQGIAKVAKNSENSQKITWPSITATKENTLAVIGGVSTYSHTSYTQWSTTSGEIISTVKTANNFMCIGKKMLSLGDTVDGYFSFDDSARNHGSACIAILLQAPEGSEVSGLNSKIRVELWSVREGYGSWEKWNVTYKRKKPTGYGFDFDNNFGG